MIRKDKVGPLFFAIDRGQKHFTAHAIYLETFILGREDMDQELCVAGLDFGDKLNGAQVAFVKAIATHTSEIFRKFCDRHLQDNITKKDLMAAIDLFIEAERRYADNKAS